MLADYKTAKISDGLRAMLGFVEKLTMTPDEVGPADIAVVRAAGVNDEQIEDAIHVCTCFSLIVRIADSFNFKLLDDAGYQASAKMLLKRGYRIV